MSLKRLTLFGRVFLFTLLPFFTLQAQEKEIIDAHKKGTHSLGGIYFYIPNGNPTNSRPGYSSSTAHYFNLRYSYAFKDRWELGLDLWSSYYNSSYPLGGESKKVHINRFSIAPFIRYYLGKENFGAFLETGFRTYLFSAYGYKPDFEKQRWTENKIIVGQVESHNLYGSIGMYYHGFAKGRLGMEGAIGFGPAYNYGYSNPWGWGSDVQFRLKYFFGQGKANRKQ
jgi:hypothetical protein